MIVILAAWNLRPARGLVVGLLVLLLLVHMNRCTVRECDAISFIEGFEVHFTHTYVQADRHDGSEQFTMHTRMERWRGQRIVTIDALVVDDRALADLPDEIIVGLGAEPRLQDVADAEALVLTCQKAPRALQL